MNCLERVTLVLWWWRPDGKSRCGRSWERSGTPVEVRTMLTLRNGPRTSRYLAHGSVGSTPATLRRADLTAMAARRRPPTFVVACQEVPTSVGPRKGGALSATVLCMSMSLDGFVAGPDRIQR